MKKAIDFFTAHPARFFLLAALLWGGFMCLVSIIRGKFDLDGLLVEANGMVFDLLVFGILLSIYDEWRKKREKIELQRREKEDKIERLREEIDDYRYWDEKEATYRIVGAVRRLNKLGVSEIDLSHCFLENANLEEVSLQRSKLFWANLKRANLRKANLKSVSLCGADLQEAILWEANLEVARFDTANLQKASLVGANLEVASLLGVNLNGANLCAAKLIHAKLLGATLEGAIFERTILKGAGVYKDWFEQLEKWNVKGLEEIKEQYWIDVDGRNWTLREKQ